MSEPLRILQVCDLYEPFIGGMEEHVKALSTALVQRGHEVTVATARLPATPPEETIRGVRVSRISGWSARVLTPFYDRQAVPFHPPAPDPGVIAGLRRLTARFRPDIVHAHGWSAYSCLAQVPHRPFQLVVTMHDHGYGCAARTLLRDGHHDCPGPRLRACIRCAAHHYGAVKGPALAVALRASRPLHARAHAWVATSQYTAAANHAMLPPGGLVTVIPPVSPELPTGTPASRPAWLPAGGYLLFVGALGRHKGLHWLLDTYAGGGFTLPLVVIGTVRGDTPQNWPAGVVVRTGAAHHEVLHAWRHATAGLVPSLWPEPFGLVAVEAMRAGVPVVATRAGALPEIVSDGETGILVTPSDTAGLRSAIHRLDGDPALRRAMGLAAKSRAEQFSAGQVTSTHERLYRRLLDGAHRPGRAATAHEGEKQ